MVGKPKSCFFISPIGADRSEERKRSDQILKYIIEPVCEDCGYKATRADRIQEPGVITSQVVQKVLDSDLVIADLTGWNPNVFYELAIRHAFRKPYVQMIESNQRIPFDVAGVRTIQWDNHDLDSVAQCKIDLEASIKAIEKDPKSIESPVSVAVDIQDMRRSGKPLEQGVADIRQALEMLQRRADEILGSIANLRGSAYGSVTGLGSYFVESNVSPRIVSFGVAEPGPIFLTSAKHPREATGIVARPANVTEFAEKDVQAGDVSAKAEKTENEGKK